jgi:hypothetical protein
LLNATSDLAYQAAVLGWMNSARRGVDSHFRCSGISRLITDMPVLYRIIDADVQHAT